MTTLAWNETELHIGRTVRGTPLVVVPWREVRRLVAVDPWPRVRLDWLGDHGPITREISARTEDASGFASVVDDLFSDAARLAPAEALQVGWTAWPDTAWERAPRFPTDRDGRGAYRTSAGAETGSLVAHRELAGVFDFLFEWIVPSCGKAWGEQAREVAVTERWVWVRRRNRSVWRVPREALRDVHRFADGQVLITFGRRTQLWMPHRPGCPVVAALQG